MWVPVDHDGCTQSSDEECDTIVGIVEELLGRRVVDRDGVERSMTENDILIVAPFWNGFAARTSNADANVGQLGLSVTLH